MYGKKLALQLSLFLMALATTLMVSPTPESIHKCITNQTQPAMVWVTGG
jgi:hypothetical protein